MSNAYKKRKKNLERNYTTPVEDMSSHTMNKMMRKVKARMHSGKDQGKVSGAIFRALRQEAINEVNAKRKSESEAESL